MSSLLESAISEIDYALVTKKGGAEVKEFYLNNAKQLIREYIEETSKNNRRNRNGKQRLYTALRSFTA